MYDCTFKIILIRPIGIGKIIERSADNRVIMDTKFTTGVNFLVKRVEYGEGKIAMLRIWDINIDAHRFEFFRKNYYKDTHGALFFIDLTNRNTYEKARELYAEMKKTIDSVPFILIGVNYNMVKSTDSTLGKEARKFANEERGIYIEITPDDIEHFEKAVYELTCIIIENACIIVEND